jgi:hypothetical protein
VGQHEARDVLEARRDLLPSLAQVLRRLLFHHLDIIGVEIIPMLKKGARERRRRRRKRIKKKCGGLQIIGIMIKGMIGPWAGSP